MFQFVGRALYVEVEELCGNRVLEIHGLLTPYNRHRIPRPISSILSWRLCITLSAILRRNGLIGLVFHFSNVASSTGLEVRICLTEVYLPNSVSLIVEPTHWRRFDASLFRVPSSNSKSGCSVRADVFE